MDLLNDKFLDYLRASGISKISLKNYKSDLNNFSNWLINEIKATGASPATLTESSIFLTANTGQEYKNFLQTASTPAKTINRRLSTLRAFGRFLNIDITQNVANLPMFTPTSTEPVLAKYKEYLQKKGVAYNTLKNYLSDARKYLEGKAAETKRQASSLKHFYRSQNIAIKKIDLSPKPNYLFITLIGIYCGFIGFGLFSNYFKKPEVKPAVLSTSDTKPKKEVNFSGTLKDTDGNLVASSVNVTFTLYDAENNGTSLWNSGACLISPDTTGNFLVTLGSDCGQQLDAEIFTNNQVWLSFAIEGEAESAPMQVANTSYAVNAANLDGYTASASAGIKNIPVINDFGELALAAPTPKIKSESTSGPFAIEGAAGISLVASPTSDGSIAINPDGAGTLDLIFNGNAPKGGGFVNALNANIVAGSLYYGEVASDAQGYNLVDMRAGSIPQTKFAVDSAGNTFLAGNLNVNGAIGNLSDVRLKDKIATISNALETVQKMRGVTFNWKGQNDKRMVGLIAQEVASAEPDLTFTDNQGFMGVYYAQTVGLLVEAIKELSGRAILSPLADDGVLVISHDTKIEGNLQAQNITAENIKAKNLDDIETLLKKVESDQKLMAEAKDWNGTTTTTADLFVTNQAAINSLSISTSLALGSDLVLAVNKIDTMNNPLAIQSLALAPVEIMAGKVKIDTGGNIIAQSLSSDQVTTNKLAVNSIQTTSNSLAGTGTIPAGSTDTIITDPSITNYTLVYVTPTSTTNNQILYVKQKTDGSFTAGFTQPIETDSTFNWWVIDKRN